MIELMVDVLIDLVVMHHVRRVSRLTSSDIYHHPRQPVVINHSSVSLLIFILTLLLLLLSLSLSQLLSERDSWHTVVYSRRSLLVSRCCEAE